MLETNQSRENLPLVWYLNFLVRIIRLLRDHYNNTRSPQSRLLVLPWSRVICVSLRNGRYEPKPSQGYIPTKKAKYTRRNEPKLNTEGRESGGRGRERDAGGPRGATAPWPPSTPNHPSLHRINVPGTKRAGSRVRSRAAQAEELLSLAFLPFCPRDCALALIFRHH